MEFEEVVATRRSIRDFQDKAIPSEILDKIVEAGRIAPSFQNRQCWRYVICRDKEVIRKLALQSGLIGKVNYFIKNAPLVVVACADPGDSGKVNDQSYYLVDTAISFQQMMLTAWNFGIGSCWLAAFNENSVRKILQIPEKIKIVALSPFGYPREKKSVYSKFLTTFAGSRKRLETEKIISNNKWEL